MGVVLKQSLRNTIITYLGFGIGALNILFLYTNFLTDEYFGLVGVILSTATILMPLMAFGVPNTLVKYYSSFKDSKNSNGFLTLMLFLPLIMIIPCILLTYFAFDAIGSFLSKENTIVKGYVWYIFLIGLAMGYFEVFYAWARVQMKTVFGNFMKEVFIRICVTLLLCLVYFKVISVEVFLKALVGVYLLRTIIMKLYAYKLKFPKLDFKFPKNSKDIITFSSLIILGASAGVIVLEIDRFMINQYIKIEYVAYYSVAIFIATVIAVPSRAMHQITYPLTAEILNKKDSFALKELYQKSSLTLFIISGLLFILIVLNLNDLYTLIPKEYGGGLIVVLLIGLAKLYDSLLGNNNSILYNSDYYKTVLLMGVCLAIMTILFNMWLIPQYGLDGAALATFLAICIFNTAKLFYVQAKFKILPFTTDTFKVLGILLLIGIPLYFLELPFYALINIVLKSIFVVVLYIGMLYKFKISEDVFGVLSKFLRK